ncbi:hypothetical protein LCM01_11375 [Bacillus thuringiensis]|uniref:hypothetical protein n=1 Tax=Bacillus thuringiensis TaxID=1428 RepID=UPI001CD53595|nr:hypothetical protein [Bacillus thuringiensis]MCA1001011.1 hypothetical protein [Bacillus thuringiensis]
MSRVKILIDLGEYFAIQFKKDFVPVCLNYHRMKDNVLTVKEKRGLVQGKHIIE